MCMAYVPQNGEFKADEESVLGLDGEVESSDKESLCDWVPLGGEVRSLEKVVA